MLKKRRAQGISFNVIIIAVLALVVLVVMIVIFSQNTGKSVTSINNCESRGGVCEHSSCPSGRFPIPNAECENKNPCCGKLPGSE